jgi:hypothetical protein
MDAWGWDELQPWHGRGVLGQEADQLAAGALRAQVAGAPVAEGRRLDLEDRNPGGASDVHGVVARARVDDQDLKTQFLRETAASTSPSQRAPSLTGMTTDALGAGSASIPRAYRRVTGPLRQRLRACATRLSPTGNERRSSTARQYGSIRS